MKVRSLEPTPNPNAFKFNLEEKLCRSPRSFPSVESAKDDPLASLLFEIEGVESVFYLDSFVTISKQEDADWEAVMIETGQRLIDFDLEAIPLEDPESEAAEGPELDEETSEILQKINTVIDQMVRPALADDGGGLEILGLDNNTVFIRYQGACGSCPSATSGTLHAIERLIQHQVAPELQVLPA